MTQLLSIFLHLVTMKSQKFVVIFDGYVPSIEEYPMGGPVFSYWSRESLVDQSECFILAHVVYKREQCDHILRSLDVLLCACDALAHFKKATKIN